MPLFDFRCPRCHVTVELLVKSTDTPACPTCAGVTMEKLVSTLAPAGKTAELIKGARAQAAREGHFSHYARNERPRRR